ncbi:MAG: hypothetical protein WC707_06285 [Candidatus Babeliaceae bacterium]|jgi:hypothetical protein
MHIISIALALLLTNSAHAKMVEFAEDGYLIQAPEAVTTIAARAAQLVDFDNNYEIAAPKKAGIQINPWNKFAVYGIHPQSKNPFMIINPEWLLNIPQAQQDFLLARYFMVFKQGVTPLSLKIIPYVVMLFAFCLTLAIFWLLGKTPLINKPALRVLAAFCIATIFNLLVTNKVQVKVTKYFGAQFDMQIIKMTVQKTGNRDAAIKTLELLDTAVKDELKTDKIFWAPYEHMFENYAKELKSLNP